MAGRELHTEIKKQRKFTIEIGCIVKNRGTIHCEMSGTFVFACFAQAATWTFYSFFHCQCPTRGSRKDFARSFSSASVTFWSAYMFFRRLRSLQRCTRRCSPRRSQWQCSQWQRSQRRSQRRCSQRRPRPGGKVVELLMQIQ